MERIVSLGSEGYLYPVTEKYDEWAKYEIKRLKKQRT
jgi:hypothetical protein